MSVFNLWSKAANPFPSFSAPSADIKMGKSDDVPKKVSKSESSATRKFNMVDVSGLNIALYALLKNITYRQPYAKPAALRHISKMRAHLRRPARPKRCAPPENMYGMQQLPSDAHKPRGLASAR